ncbi:MAG TPA: chorismate-binding protein, partial [Chitinophagaceae bacterium]
MKQATSTNCIFTVSNFTLVKEKVLSWANQFSTFCFLDNHHYQVKAHSVECILGAGVVDFIETNTSNALEQLQEFIGETKKWVFGHLGYDLKTEIKNSHCPVDDHIQFPDLFFYQPKVVIRFDEKEMTIESEAGNEEEIYREILEVGNSKPGVNSTIQIHNRIERDEYISIINKLKAHILRGDCYEINFCQEFFAENVIIDPFSIYQKLSAISPNPFSAFYKLNDKYLICASPERFLRKEGNKILSQPIKGTSTRAA